MPLVTQLLLDIYGWRGTVLLLSGISAHGIACGALFKPIITVYARVSSSGKTKAEVVSSRQKFTDNLKNYLDTSIFNNLTFLTCLSLFAGSGFCNTGWIIYVVPHVIDVGFTPYEASLVATIGGFASFAGKVIHPLTGLLLSSKVQLYISIFIMASSFAFDVLASSSRSYVGLVACAVGFGIGDGIVSTAIYPILNDDIDDDQMINVVGWLYAVYGLASILSGFTCGKLNFATPLAILTILSKPSQYFRMAVGGRVCLTLQRMSYRTFFSSMLFFIFYLFFSIFCIFQDGCMIRREVTASHFCF